MFPVKNLKEWFLSAQRSLPWRENPHPYSIWISEIMLQQTQASVVIPYFLKWMELFPTIEKLAAASLEEIIKIWEGLGYYSRARAIHETALYIVKELNGVFPSEKSELSRLKGIGEYTLGAILSFAFHKKIPAIDGNVKRVLSRFFLIDDPIDCTSTFKKLYQTVDSFLPDEEPWIINEALIELGALICKKRPDCKNCPLKNHCKAYQFNKQEELPVKKRSTPKTTLIHRHVFIIKKENCYLVKKGRGEKLLRDLYEFPSIDSDQSIRYSSKELEELLFNTWRIKGCYLANQPEEEQGYTRYLIKLYPYLFKAVDKVSTCSEIWIEDQYLAQLPFSSGHRRILKNIIHNNALQEA